MFQRPNDAFSQFYYSVQLQKRIQDRQLSVKWNDGKVINYPHNYWPDYCTRSSCFNLAIGKRTFSSSVFNKHDQATIKTAHINQDNDQVHVEWINNDAHTMSSYQLDELKSHRLADSSENQQLRIKRRLWDRHQNNNIPRFEFNKVLNDKFQLYDWLRSILESGAAIIDNVPKEVGQLQKITQQVTDLRHSFSGSEMILLLIEQTMN